MNQSESLAAVEQLLARGKVQLALKKVQMIADIPRQDVVLLNRLGDLLARHKQVDEAVGYYARIAEHFAQSGFLPKAVAIQKKILRLDPNRLSAAVSLGQLFGRQKLLGEARKYLLYAANQFVKAKEFTKAREVFEQLVAGEPDCVNHRVRLAEARAAEGDSQQAVDELVRVGENLLEQDKLDDAEKIFARACQLQPDGEKPLIGTARCLARSDRAEEAIALLEDAAGHGKHGPGLLGELARIYTMVGRSKDGLDLLQATPITAVPDTTWRRIFVAALEQGQSDDWWLGLDALCQKMNGSSDASAMADLLPHLTDLEPDGHIPALRRLADLHERRTEVGGAVKALDALARAYRARAMEDEAREVLVRLQRIAPPDEEPTVVVQEPPAPAIQIEPTALVEESAPRDVPLEAEAPAVPLNRADEEFIEGRVTQAEVLEKYDLVPQALEQLDEAAQRFPGHAPIHERRVELLRALQDAGRLAEVLAQLALALRAGGDSTAASQVAAEASSMTELSAGSRRLLEKLGLLAPLQTDRETASRPSSSSQPSQTPAAANLVEEGSPANLGDEVVIELDAVDDDAPAATPASHPGPEARQTRTRVPAPDVIEEIQAIAARDRNDARRRLDALLLLGYAAPELDRLRQELVAEPVVDQAPPELQGPPELPQAQAETETEEPQARGSDVGIGLELLEGLDEPVPAEKESDHDVGQILEEFKREVEEQIPADDYQAHYDLGIGYKEMGLIDDAIHEFQLAAGSPDLVRQAFSMIAMCHRDREDPSQAAQWYRQALESASLDDEAAQSLRYDLAEVLLQNGDTEEALALFRGLLAVDPAFRDVQGRVSELESRLQS